MFGVQTRITTTPERVQTAVEKGAYKSFSHAAASIRKSARESIQVRSKSDPPGPPGGPVRTRRGRGGRLAKRAILYKADRQGAVIGFSAEMIDQVMEVHEHGKARGGVQFPKRPTMAPALQRNLARFHREWKGAIS